MVARRAPRDGNSNQEPDRSAHLKAVPVEEISGIVQPLNARFIDGQMVGALEIAKDVTYVQRLSEKILDLHEHISQRKKTRNERRVSK